MELLEYQENEQVFCFTIRLFEENKLYNRGEFTEIFGFNCLTKTIFDCSVKFLDNFLRPNMISVYQVLWGENRIVNGSVYANISLSQENCQQLISLIKSGKAECGYMFSVTDDEWENIDSDQPLRTINKIDKIPMLIFTEEEK